MKNLVKLFSVAAFASTLLFSACNTDKCVSDKIDCGANGTCAEGLCICTDGYEGTKCDTLSRTKMIYSGYTVTGTYSVDSAGVRVVTSAPQSYNSDITAGAADNQVKVSKFADYGSVALVVSSVKGNNLTIASQVLGGGEFSGSGIYDATSKKITFNYSVKAGVQTESGTLVYTR